MSQLSRLCLAGVLILFRVRVARALETCAPVVRTTDYCQVLEDPCSLTQMYKEGCSPSSKCSTVAAGSSCDEACQRCVPVCSAEFLKNFRGNNLDDYCRLPECPPPSRYLADTPLCRSVIETGADCIQSDGGVHKFNPQAAAECPIQCGICNDTRVPTPEPTRAPTAPPGRKKKTTKKGSASGVLFGAIYIEIAVGAFLFVVLGVLLWRRVKRRRKEERRNRAAGLYKNYR